MTREAKIDIKKYTDPATDPTKFKSISGGIEFEGLRDALENFKEQEPEIVNNITEFADQFGGQENAVKKFGAITGAMEDLNLRLSGEPSTSDISPGAITPTPSIQTGEYRVADASGNIPAPSGDATTTVPKVSIPSVQGGTTVPSGDEVDRPYWYDKPVDTQMNNLLKPTFEGEIKAPTSTSTYPTTPLGSPFHPDTIPEELRTIPGAGAETTVPGAGGNSLLDAINYRGNLSEFMAGDRDVSKLTQEQALDFSGGSGAIPIGRDSTARSSVGVINSILGLGVGQVTAERIGNIVKNMAFPGGNPINAIQRAKSMLDNAKSGMSPAAYLATGNFILSQGLNAARQLDEINTDTNYGKLVTDYAKNIGANISNALGGATNIAFDPKGTLDEYSKWIQFGDGVMRTNQEQINGKSVYVFNKDGTLSTATGLGPLTMFLGPVGTAMSFTDKIRGMTGAKAEQAQEALSLSSAIRAGGHEVVINDKHFEDTNFGIYGNGKDNFANVGLRVLGGPAHVLNINFNLGKIDSNTKLTDLTDLQLRDAMVGGVSPYDPEHAEQATKQLRQQFIAASKVLKSGGTIGGLAKAMAEKSDRAIRLHNSMLNKVSGYEFITEENMGSFDMANVDIAKKNYVMSQTRGQKAPPPEESESEDTRDPWGVKYDTTQQVRTYAPTFTPSPSSDPITDHPGSTADTPVGDTDWYV